MSDETPAPAIDTTLLARMTGQSGDRRTLEAVCLPMAERITPMFEKAASKAMGFPITAAFSDFDTGTWAELSEGMSEHPAVRIAAIDDWCDFFLLATDNVFVIALLEGMLGGDLPARDAVTARDLSAIELDIASLMFTAFVDGIQSLIASPQTQGNRLHPPGAEKSTEEDTGSSASVRLTFTLFAGDLEAPFHVILPQRPLLKTELTGAADGEPQAADRPEWIEQLSHQVTSSFVTLQADIALADMSLGEVARLQPGDVLPFADEGSVRALLKAGGKEIFWCEFGKAGDRYTVRVQEQHLPEQGLIKELIAG